MEKKALKFGSFLGRTANNMGLPFLSAQVIVQGPCIPVAVCFIMYPQAIHAGNGLGGFLPGEVIVEITMDNRVCLQADQRLLQVVHGVHYEVVAGRIDATSSFSRLFQRRMKGSP